MSSRCHATKIDFNAPGQFLLLAGFFIGTTQFSPANGWKGTVQNEFTDLGCFALVD